MLAWCVCACALARGAHIATIKNPCPYAMKQQPSITFSATVSPVRHSGTKSITLAHIPHAAAAAAAAHLRTDLIDVRHAAACFATAAGRQAPGQTGGCAWYCMMDREEGPQEYVQRGCAPNGEPPHQTCVSQNSAQLVHPIECGGTHAVQLCPGRGECVDGECRNAARRQVRDGLGCACKRVLRVPPGGGTHAGGRPKCCEEVRDQRQDGRNEPVRQASKQTNKQTNFGLSDLPMSRLSSHHSPSCQHSGPGTAARYHSIA